MARIGKGCMISKRAVIIGEVEIREESSVWPYAVIRGDLNYVRIGKGCNVQDSVVIHVTPEFPVEIGDYVSIGHGAVIHGAKIEDYVVVGMNATVLDGAKIGRGSVIGAGAVVPPGKEIPPNSLVLGVPGQVKDRGEKYFEMAKRNAEVYISLSRRYLGGEFGEIRGDRVRNNRYEFPEGARGDISREGEGAG